VNFIETTNNVGQRSIPLQAALGMKWLSKILTNGSFILFLKRKILFQNSKFEKFAERRVRVKVFDTTPNKKKVVQIICSSVLL
jgi:hypothetical protein